MLDHIRTAGAEDFGALWRFYEDVCRAQERDEYGPDWHLGVYPAAADLKGHVAAGEILTGWKDGRLAAAMAVTGGEDEMYLGVPWPLGAPPEQVAALHLFAVHPDFRGRGAAREMLASLFDRARARGLRAVHLDVIEGNLAAEKLYLEAGFAFAGTRRVHYDDLGDTIVRLFEYAL
ncbi:GNAT family N-acetyltransferase [Pyramidobacter sp.]|uniref:GNAT family N-acetyltransferase n=1 Tax=Pyramidobacter sp. TaxID=1943581 RepID=UPI0025F88342|nr:GNAT family N-acetyltransferase [Pyramidobacter sp.]MCI7402612.1 GNAT family N-acetyltransferase [Pyramidobacter sp.]MDY3213237.1 GNAT family N-acetyltransferase [Pyramidobacter sp.]